MNVRLKYTPAQLDIFFPQERARHTIIPKGRRFGATHGAANACIEWALEGMPILWGDTVSGNVMRYADRYFLPTLKANGIDVDWNRQDKVMKIAGRGYVDFRSADRPENWEGFGYRKVVLNEAGIILSNPYLYTNAVRPMMLDHPDAELFALGVPKGKKLKDGSQHPFHQLWERIGAPGYRGKTYTSYDNPLLSAEDVQALEADIASMDAEQVKQEIYGQFIDRSSGNPFAFALDMQRHFKTAERRPNDYHYFSLDFNVEPFTAICSHIWNDMAGHHFHTFAEIALKEASIQGMAEWINSTCPQTHLIRITGDRGGMSRSIGTRGPVQLFNELKRELRLSDGHFIVPPNPTHLKSREDCNYVLSVHPDHVVDHSCTRLKSDLQLVEVDETGSIIKHDRTKVEQRADLLDNWRYTVNTFMRRWIDMHRGKRAA